MRIILYIFLLFILLPCFNISAKHIVGGQMYYNTIERGVYEFHLVLYRDCNDEGNLFDSQINPASGIVGTITIYREDMLDSVFFSTFLDAPDIDTLDSLAPDVCQYSYFDLCIQRAEYIYTLDLPVSEHSYIVSYQRCCRNGTISNIESPISTGSTYTIEITPLAQELERSSLRFPETPTSVACLESSVELQHTAITPNQTMETEIRYEFCSPLVGGGLGGSGSNPGTIRDPDGIAPDPDLPPPYDEVLFVGGEFSAGTPLGGSPPVQINSETGTVSGNIMQVGQYLYGVCASEYDLNGNLISRVLRDFELNTIQCVDSIEAAIRADSIDSEGNYVINICDSCFFLFDASSPKEYVETKTWTLPREADTFSVDRNGFILCLREPGEYFGSLVINEGQSCQDTAHFRLIRHSYVGVNLSVDYDTCRSGDVSLEARELNPFGAEINRRRWIFSNSVVSNTDTLVITEDELNRGKNIVYYDMKTEECEFNRGQIAFEYYPLPDNYMIHNTASRVCLPSEAEFRIDGRDFSLASPYRFYWDFGDGTARNFGAQYVNHLYEENGQYTVRVIIENPMGCRDTVIVADSISVWEQAVADFSVFPDPPYYVEDLISFTNQSTNSKHWEWSKNGVVFSSAKDVEHAFASEGNYQVQLISSNEGNCADTAIQVLEVTRESKFHLPNAFRPNSSSNNRLYRGQGHLSSIQDFEMKIFDRWGELVFSTQDPTKGWNGRKSNTGPLLPAGVYICRVIYNDQSGKEVQLQEFATLIR